MRSVARSYEYNLDSSVTTTTPMEWLQRFPQPTVKYFDFRVSGFRNPIYKSLIDWTLIALSLPIVFPVFILTAIAIRLESKGPALFRQRRIGMGGRSFLIYKFRSMALDADISGAQFATEEDPRITRVGRFIRKFRIDEIPQFINVLKGEMSLIGPRPEQPDFVARFRNEIEDYDLRHLVKPGITGWAQVNHGYCADVVNTRKKLRYDLFYIRNRCLRLELIVVYKTIQTILTGFGAR